MNDEVFFQVRYTVTVGERDDLLRDLAQLRMAESSRPIRCFCWSVGRAARLSKRIQARRILRSSLT